MTERRTNLKNHLLKDRIRKFPSLSNFVVHYYETSLTGIRGGQSNKGQRCWYGKKYIRSVLVMVVLSGKGWRR